MTFKALRILMTCAVFFGPLAEARNCVKGKPCGNSCIAKNDVCHKEGGASTAAPVGQVPPAMAPRPSAATSNQPTGPAAAPAPAVAPAAPVAAPAMPPAAAAAGSGEPNQVGKVKTCKKGKPCGNSCIPKDAECHI